MQPKGLPQAISFRQFANFRYFCFIGLALFISLAKADSLGQLSNADQAAVARICLPVQYQEGAAAYRECVLTEVEARDTQGIPTTSVLSFDEQYALQQICQPSASPSAVAYQECVDQQLDALGQIPMTQLDSFDSDDAYALQQNCFDTQLAEGVKAYRQCINEAAAGLQALPRPDLSKLTLLQRNALQLRCSAQHTVAADYRQCLLDALTIAAPTAAIVATTPVPIEPGEIELAPVTSPAAEIPPESAPETAPESAPDPEIVRSNVASALNNTDQEASQAATPTTTIATNLENDATSVLALPTDKPLNIIEPVDTSNVAQPISASSDNIAAPLAAAEQNTTAAPVLETELTEPETASKSATSIIEQLWNKLQSSVSGLDNLNQMIVAAAMALPILLLGFWYLMRDKGRETEVERYAPGERNPLMDRIRPSQQQQNRPEPAYDDPTQREVDPDISMDQTDRLNLSQQANDMFGEMPVSRPQTVNLDDVETLDLSDTGRQDPKANDVDLSRLANDIDADTDGAGHHTQQPSETSEEAAVEPLGSAVRAGLLAWLNQQPIDARQALAIEFLIYWLAYADDRYESAMKQTIFQIRDPDEHEQIKRWVLMQDVYAFSDVVYWLQHNSSIAQREQILDLLMALLINENALTPVQNTTLRFLSDAFGLGHDQLDERFIQAYGHSMPPLPRVDKLQWWERQPLDQQRRWDARTVSQQSRDVQYRVKLGLPLGGEVREEDITASFNRAEARCNPQRFNLLGPREQSLAERQFTKFEFAKDSLLEVSA